MNEVSRTCVGCRKKFEKDILVRFHISEGIVEDQGEYNTGRGAYLCATCIKEYNNPGKTAKQQYIQKALFRELNKGKRKNE